MSEPGASRVNVAAKDVFEASEALVAAGQTPTQGRIRDYLGRGSRGTIHKYLRQWKENCFKKGLDLQSNSTMENNALLEKKNILEKVLQNQILEQEKLSAQMLETERRLMQVKEKNRALLADLEKSKSQYAILENAYKDLKDAYQVLQASQDNVIQTLLNDKNQHIGSLRQELKELNEESLIVVKDIGYKGDDALMIEKVKMIHLNDQVKALEKTVADLKKELLKAQVVKDRKNGFEIKRISE